MFMPFGRNLRSQLGLRVLGAVLATILSSSSTSVLAQATPPPVDDTAVAPAEPTTAREWFTRGEDEYRVGQYQAAAEAWEHAFALDPRPRIKYNLAQAYERLGRLEEAVAAYEHYTTNSDPGDPVYPDAMARLTALRQRVAQTGVVLRGGPNGGEIFIDGQPWGVTPRPDRIAVSPGTHRIEVRYPEERAFRASIAVPAGQATEVEITEDAITGNTTQIVEVEAAPNHAMLFAGAGIAGAGVATLIYGIERQTKVSACTEGDNYCENLAAGQTQRSIGLAVGGTLTAAGAALIVVDLLRHSAYRSRHETALTCAPLLAGATCRLRF
jgi:hypothetical protein